MTDATALFRQMLDLSEGDRSMLKVVAMGKVSTSDQLCTAPGSPNFRLWSAMVEKGWMVRLPDMVPDPEKHPGVATPCFAVTDAGRSIMPDFLAAFARYHDSHIGKMTELLNGLCFGFAKEFREQAMKSGATNEDFVLLAGLTVARIVNTSFPAKYREGVVERIFEQTKKRVKEFSGKTD